MKTVKNLEKNELSILIENKEKNESMQQVLSEVLGIDSYTAKKCLDYLAYYVNNPIKQKKVLFYSRIPEIFDNELFTISMINIDDENLEREMINCFLKNEINNSHDFVTCMDNYYNLENGKQMVKSKLPNII